MFDTLALMSDWSHMPQAEVPLEYNVFLSTSSHEHDAVQGKGVVEHLLS